MDLATIGKKPIETLKALFQTLKKDKLQKLFKYEKEDQHTTLHLGNSRFFIHLKSIKFHFEALIYLQCPKIIYLNHAILNEIVGLRAL